MDNIYISNNEDWTLLNKSKYGYVYGSKDNLKKRLIDSREQHSELSKFKYILSFEKIDCYKLPYKEIDKVISLCISNIDKINELEKIYNIELPLCRELNKYLIISKTKISNEFIKNNREDILLRVLKEEFPKLGLNLIKEYKKEEINEINNSYIKEERKNSQGENNETSILKLENKKPKKRESVNTPLLI